MKPKDKSGVQLPPRMQHQGLLQLESGPKWLELPSTNGRLFALGTYEGAAHFLDEKQEPVWKDFK